MQTNFYEDPPYEKPPKIYEDYPSWTGDEENIYLTNLPEYAKEALESGEYSRVGYIADTWDDRQSMAKYAGANPSLGTIDVDVDGVRFQIEDTELGPGGKRNAPVQPKEEDLMVYEEWQKFKEQITPEIEREATAKADEARSRILKANYGNVADESLLTIDEKMKIDTAGASVYNSVYQHTVDQELTGYRNIFDKTYTKRIEEQKNLREKMEEGQKNLREKMEERQRHERDTQAKLTGEIRKEERAASKGPTSSDLKRLSDLVAIATQDGQEPSASDVTIIQEMANKAGYKFAKVPGEKYRRGMPGVDWFDSDVKEEPGTWQLVPKYKEGDIVVKDGKRYRVRLKQR